MGRPSALGYGWGPYGHPQSTSTLWRRPGGGPYSVNAGYGVGDWAEQVTWRILPEHTRAEDGLGSQVPEPLRGMIDAVKPLLNELIAKWRAFPELWDANLCPLPQLQALAYNVGITLDVSKPERLQRSETLNASQLFLHKGTDTGYTIVAAFEGLLVEIVPLWADGQEPTANLTSAPPTAFVPQYDEVPADDIAMDSVYDNRFALWPRGLYVRDDVRTARLRLIFYPTANQNQDFDPDVADRIRERLLRFKPIHVIVDRVVFDGLRGPSAPWRSSIDAGQFGVGMWTGTVTGSEYSSSGAWYDTVVADTV